MQPAGTRALLAAILGAGLAPAWAGDGNKATSAPAPAPTGPGLGAAKAAPGPSDEEARAMKLVRQHLPELAEVLGPLKAANPAEYRKAIADLAAEACKQDEIRGKNAARADLALEDWKARTRVELIAAQLAGSADPAKADELRRAIETRVDQTIRRHRFEFDQSEAAVARLRDNLARAEANRDKARDELKKVEGNREARIENRYQALIPKKKVPPTATKPKAKASAPPPMPPANPAASSRADSAAGSDAVPPPVVTRTGPGPGLPTPQPIAPTTLPAAPAAIAGEPR